MSIERNVFERSHVNFDKLIDYGFVYDNGKYYYSSVIIKDLFRADLVIDNKGNVMGKVIDIEVGLEYLPIRINNGVGEYVNQVKNSYIELLKDIRDNCFVHDYFISDQANRIVKYIIHKYHDYPEFLWDKYPFFGIFRSKVNNKWYGIIMNVSFRKLGINSDKEVEVINIKVGSNDIHELLNIEGIYPGYHMNKKSWVSIVLNNTLSDEEIIKYLDKSYDLVSS